MQGCGPLCGRDEGRGSRGPIQRCPHGNPGSHHIPDASFHSHSKPVTKSFQLHFTHMDSSPGAPGAAQFYDVAATPSSPPPTNAGDPLGWEGSQSLPHGYAVPPLALPGSPRTQWDRTQPCEVGATVIPRPIQEIRKCSSVFGTWAWARSPGGGSLQPEAFQLGRGPRSVWDKKQRLEIVLIHCRDCAISVCVIKNLGTQGLEPSRELWGLQPPPMPLGAP